MASSIACQSLAMHRYSAKKRRTAMYGTMKTKKPMKKVKGNSKKSKKTMKTTKKVGGMGY
jgi:hypothetical protein